MDSFTPKILYEDRYLLVCVKPVGYLSEPGNGRNLPDALSAYYREKNLPDSVFTVHRLDRVVGGVMLFSRRADITGKLAAQVTGRELEKEYCAVLRGVPAEKSAVLCDLLFRDSAKNKTYVVKRMRKGVRDAELEYSLLGTAEKDGQPLSLVRVLLHTGRTHQIRVQFSSRQLPLLGDIRYGSRDDACETALWARRLAFRHPVSGKRMEFTCPPPDAYPWSLFDEALL